MQIVANRGKARTLVVSLGWCNVHYVYSYIPKFHSEEHYAIYELRDTVMIESDPFITNVLLEFTREEGWIYDS